MYDTADTIAAITTPLGESGIGAVRISGPVPMPEEIKYLKVNRKFL